MYHRLISDVKMKIIPAPFRKPFKKSGMGIKLNVNSNRPRGSMNFKGINVLIDQWSF